MSIVIIGSSNSDMVVRVPHIPSKGETVIGKSFDVLPGGKGANQAVAAARLGADINFIASIGSDSFGDKAIENFKKDSINIDSIIRPNTNSGTAFIFVDDNGQNSIAVSPESNALLRPEHIENNATIISNASHVLAQLETPIETIIHASEISKREQVPFILNPAPAQELPDQLLSNTYILTPNETEASILSGIEVIDIESATLAANIILKKGVEIVIITMGANGCLYVDKSKSKHIKSYTVDVIDTTAAGDTFNGALVHLLAKGKSIDEAIQFANAASALSVTKFGAQPSAPYIQEVIEFMDLNDHRNILDLR
jgi:ribokinase